MRTDGQTDMTKLIVSLRNSRLKLVPSSHTAFMCFVCISEQTANFALYDKLIGFYNRDEKCLVRGAN